MQGGGRDTLRLLQRGALLEAPLPERTGQDAHAEDGQGDPDGSHRDGGEVGSPDQGREFGGFSMKCFFFFTLPAGVNRFGHMKQHVTSYIEGFLGKLTCLSSKYTLLDYQYSKVKVYDYQVSFTCLSNLLYLIIKLTYDYQVKVLSNRLLAYQVKGMAV